MTRVAPIRNCAVTHGPLPAGGGGNAQPATVYTVVSVTICCPPTFTTAYMEKAPHE